MGDNLDVQVKQKRPRHYYPIRAEKIEKGTVYASGMVSDQKCVVENLRWLKRQMEKEERQLRQMSHDMHLKSMPDKWTPYHSQETK